jgi:hypothetical protein
MRGRSPRAVPSTKSSSRTFTRSSSRGGDNNNNNNNTNSTRIKLSRRSSFDFGVKKSSRGSSATNANTNNSSNKRSALRKGGGIKLHHEIHVEPETAAEQQQHGRSFSRSNSASGRRGRSKTPKSSSHIPQSTTGGSGGGGLAMPKLFRSLSRPSGLRNKGRSISMKPQKTTKSDDDILNANLGVIDANSRDGDDDGGENGKQKRRRGKSLPAKPTGGFMRMATLGKVFHVGGGGGHQNEKNNSNTNNNMSSRNINHKMSSRDMNYNSSSRDINNNNSSSANLETSARDFMRSSTSNNNNHRTGASKSRERNRKSKSREPRGRSKSKPKMTSVNMSGGKAKQKSKQSATTTHNNNSSMRNVHKSKRKTQDATNNNNINKKHSERTHNKRQRAKSMPPMGGLKNAWIDIDDMHRESQRAPLVSPLPSLDSSWRYQHVKLNRELRKSGVGGRERYAVKGDGKRGNLGCGGKGGVHDRRYRPKYRSRSMPSKRDRKNDPNLSPELNRYAFNAEGALVPYNSEQLATAFDTSEREGPVTVSGRGYYDEFTFGEESGTFFGRPPEPVMSLNGSLDGTFEESNLNENPKESPMDDDEIAMKDVIGTKDEIETKGSGEIGNLGDDGSAGSMTGHAPSITSEARSASSDTKSARMAPPLHSEIRSRMPAFKHERSSVYSAEKKSKGTPEQNQPQQPTAREIDVVSVDTSRQQLSELTMPTVLLRAPPFHLQILSKKPKTKSASAAVESSEPHYRHALHDIDVHSTFTKEQVSELTTPTAIARAPPLLSQILKRKPSEKHASLAALLEEKRSNKKAEVASPSVPPSSSPPSNKPIPPPPPKRPPPPRAQRSKPPSPRHEKPVVAADTLEDLAASFFSAQLAPCDEEHSIGPEDLERSNTNLRRRQQHLSKSYDVFEEPKLREEGTQSFPADLNRRQSSESALSNAAAQLLSMQSTGTQSSNRAVGINAQPLHARHQSQPSFGRVTSQSSGLAHHSSGNLLNNNVHSRSRKVDNMPFIDSHGEFGLYTGEVNEDSRPNGKGTIKYGNGVFFEGKWTNGLRDSDNPAQRERMLSGFTSWKGSSTGKKGSSNKVYGMAWIDRTGKSGSYTGDVNSDSIPHGSGVMKYDFGLIAEGEWVNGVLITGSQGGGMQPGFLAGTVYGAPPMSMYQQQPYNPQQAFIPQQSFSGGTVYYGGPPPPNSFVMRNNHGGP